MADEQANITREGQALQDAMLIHKEARKSLNDAREKLEAWKSDNEGYDEMDPYLLRLEQKVKDAYQAYGIAGQELKNAEQRSQNAREAGGLTTTSFNVIVPSTGGGGKFVFVFLFFY